jgi:hypothetical protein
MKPEPISVVRAMIAKAIMDLQVDLAGYDTQTPEWAIASIQLETLREVMVWVKEVESNK